MTGIGPQSVRTTEAGDLCPGSSKAPGNFSIHTNPCPSGQQGVLVIIGHLEVAVVTDDRACPSFLDKYGHQPATRAPSEPLGLPVIADPLVTARTEGFSAIATMFFKSSLGGVLLYLLFGGSPDISVGLYAGAQRVLAFVKVFSGLVIGVIGQVLVALWTAVDVGEEIPPPASTHE